MATGADHAKFKICDDIRVRLKVDTDMAMSHQEVHSLFEAEFPLAIRLQLVRDAKDAFAEARLLLGKASFARPQERDLQPLAVRAAFETRLSRLVAPGITVTNRPNSKKTSSFVEISTAGATLTALTRATSPAKVPETLYRSSRAQASQLGLFDPPANQVASMPVYALFIYGGKKDITLAKVFFPIPDEPLATIPPLNLLHEFNQYAAEMERVMVVGRPAEPLARVEVAIKQPSDERDHPQSSDQQK